MLRPRNQLLIPLNRQIARLFSQFTQQFSDRHPLGKTLWVAVDGHFDFQYGLPV